jgi:hypothetical protein
MCELAVASVRSVNWRAYSDRRPSFPTILMKAYLITTGVVFALLVVVHVWRLIVERSVLSEPIFLIITVIAAGFSVWAFRLLRLTAPRQN